VLSTVFSKVVHRLFHAPQGVGKSVVNRQAKPVGKAVGNSGRDGSRPQAIPAAADFFLVLFLYSILLGGKQYE